MPNKSAVLTVGVSFFTSFIVFWVPACVATVPYTEC